ncbi:MerR family transcriptional regulator [Actinoplanes sp. NPDC051633]|uniref:MerR family transcriptional regulator n=1 Tax=Actinoplanes sp. NPDC051633 TaxID=3155670 RepID=UPI0034469964
MMGEALTAGAVARRLGVAVTTLRTWHQRYGLGPSRHVPGQHRRYTAEDLDRLEVMRRLTAQGVAPAEAAAWAKRVPVPLDSAPAADPGWAAAAAEIEPDGAASDGASPDGAAGDGAAPGGNTRDGGGHAIPVGRAGPTARGLARAAMRLDGPAQRDLLEMVVQRRGVVRAWDEVIMPVLIGIGERYAATLRYIEVEHLLSRSVTEVLSGVSRPPAGTSPRILLAAADEEQHTLPLEALAAALAENGVPTRLLGARVPPASLSDAIERTGPAAVLLWSQTPHTGNAAQLERLLHGPHRPLLVAAAGPGWVKDTLPAEVSLFGDLQEAIAALTAAATQ